MKATREAGQAADRAEKLRQALDATKAVIFRNIFLSSGPPGERTRA